MYATDGEKETQQSIFTTFIRLSKEVDLPLNVHSRSAGRKVVELLMAEGVTRVQLHAFDAKASAAKPAVEAGYFFSIPPSVVRSRQKQKLVKALPLETLLLWKLIVSMHLKTRFPTLRKRPGCTYLE
ncbi:MAG: TatD family hydrolase [Deltaproteobacteria bacterium]|nr:TatD family hydrolase [Deltaproteobacteria bacterium]